MSNKRLALFFDGTWNEPGDHTNVWRLYLMTAPQGKDGASQEKFYDPGVGTRWHDRLTGGAFGAGLSANVREGYRWLVEHYDPGDEVYLFGFSRGAFTARSLAGFIARCGLLRPEAPISVARLFERYKSDTATPLYKLRWQERNEPGRSFDFEERALLRHSTYHRNLITMVGVWDTVGSIGVPIGQVRGISTDTLQFHNTHLSTTVKHSYQALALDEYRKPYWAILWTIFELDVAELQDPLQPGGRYVEQRWFSGAHANVGGGYQSDILPDRPLAWIQEKAEQCGLAMRTHVHADDADLDVMPCDSYSQFLKGLWKLATLGKRYVRWVMSKPVRREVTRTGETGHVRTVNERIDISVFQRCKRHASYRPLSLKEWAARLGLSLEAIIEAPEQHAELWRSIGEAGVEEAVRNTRG